MFFLQKRSSGFTLIEVMIALVILAIGILGLASLQIVSIRGNAFSSEMSSSAMLAQGRLEILRNLTFTDVFTDPDLTEVGNPHQVTENIKGITYRVQWNVDDNPSGDMKTVTVTVGWTGSAAGQQASHDYSTSFTTFIAQR